MVFNVHYSTLVNKITLLRSPSLGLIFIVDQDESWWVQEVCRICVSQRLFRNKVLQQKNFLEDVYKAISYFKIDCITKQYKKTLNFYWDSWQKCKILLCKILKNAAYASIFEGKLFLPTHSSKVNIWYAFYLCSDVPSIYKTECVH